MRDFRIVQAKSLLPVTFLEPIRGFLPPSVRLVGQRFNLTKEVLYNGLTVSATNFIIRSSTELIVAIPPSQVGKDLYGLQVVSTVQLTGVAALVQFAVSKPPQMVEGVDRMAQAFLMELLSSKNSDIWYPSDGGGVLKLIGRSTSNSGGKSVAADLALGVDATRKSILRKQAGDSRIPLSERLLSSALHSISFDPQTTALSAEIDLRNMQNQTTRLGVS